MQGGRYPSRQQVQPVRHGSHQSLDRPSAEASQDHPPSWVWQVRRGRGNDQAEVENAVEVPTDYTSTRMNDSSPQPRIPSEEIAGLVERVTFFNEESGFAVLRVKVRGQRDLVTVLGSLPSVSAGEWLSEKDDCKSMAVRLAQTAKASIT